MKPVLGELDIVQNTALGAVLVWRFTCGYGKRMEHRSTPLPLAFIVLPVVLNRDMREQVLRTMPASGLRVFAHKFDANREQLVALQDRLVDFRDFSWNSIKVGIACRLLSLELEQASLVPTSRTEPRNLPASIPPFLRAADRLGEWSAALTLFEITSILKIIL